MCLNLYGYVFNMRHELKIWPDYFKAVKLGIKTFEVRLNDRGFQKGDQVVLKEFNPKSIKFTGEILKFEIGYVLPIDDRRVVFSLLKL